MFGIDNILLLLAAWITAESAHQPIARYSLIGLVVIGYLVALAAIAFLALVIIGIITRRQPPRVGYTYFAGVMDKIGVKNRCSPYAARLYKRSKPLNTKNAFFAAQNRSGKMAPKVANNATDACPVTSVSAVGKS